MSMKERVHSIDITRGIIVIAATFLGTIPRGYDMLRGHAQWYGLTALDLVFPAFITIFGVSMAVAYDRKIKWDRIIRRTVLFVLLGLIFNMIVTWNVNLSTLRFTGILQFYAAIGIFVVIIMSISKKWWVALLVSFLILFLYTLLLYGTSRDYPGGIPQPDYNLSKIVDGAVFGNHQYSQGDRGYDPEGLISLMGALVNALIGLAAGRLLLTRQANNKQGYGPLLGLAVLLLLITPFLAQVIPIGKRMWSPPFITLSTGITIMLFAVCHILIDCLKYQNPLTWVIQAFGRNSLLVFFGRFIVVSLMANLVIQGVSPSRHLLGWVEGWSQFPYLTYAVIMLTLWTITACLMHWKKWYVKI